MSTALEVMSVAIGYLSYQTHNFTNITNAGNTAPQHPLPQRLVLIFFFFGRR